MSRCPRRPVHFKPAVLIVLLAATALAVLWSSGDAPNRQNQVMGTLVVLALAGTALILWWLLFSRLPAWVRGISLVVLVAVAAAGVATLRLREVSGDLVPVFEWRRTSRQGDSPGTVAPGTMAPGSHRRRAANAALIGATDYPQYLGPRRDATVPDVRLARDWEAATPELLWRQPIGEGWSGFAVAGGLAVTSEQRGDVELVSCYDLRTGERRWSHRDGSHYAGGVMEGRGPRATPAITGRRVYALGPSGKLNALDLITGRLMWSKDIVRDNGAAVPLYGVAASPLLLDGAVVVVAGGPQARSLVAYDQLTGERLWSGGDDQAAYSSPLVATLAGVRQVIVFNAVHLAGHDATTGRVLWQEPWPRYIQRASQPLPLPGDRLFVSTGYGIGGKLYQFGRDTAGELSVHLIWETLRLKAKFTNVVHRDGYLYGLDDGVLVSLDLADGERAWKGGRYGHGHVILAGDLLLVQSEKGEVALVEPRPDAYVELGRFQAIRGKSWNTPALAGRYLVVRNATEAACYKLPVES